MPKRHWIAILNDGTKLGVRADTESEARKLILGTRTGSAGIRSIEHKSWEKIPHFRGVR